MRIRFIVFFNRPVGKQGFDKRKFRRLKLYQQQIIQLSLFLFPKEPSFFLYIIFLLLFSAYKLLLPNRIWTGNETGMQCYCIHVLN